MIHMAFIKQNKDLWDVNFMENQITIHLCGSPILLYCRQVTHSLMYVPITILVVPYIYVISLSTRINTYLLLTLSSPKPSNSLQNLSLVLLKYLIT